MNKPRENRETVKTKREAVAVTEEERKKIQVAANKKYLSRSGYIRMAVLKQLERDGF